MIRRDADGPTFARACAVRDIPMDGITQVVVDGVPVAVARTADGVFALHDACPHAAAPLSEGEIDGTTIECWLHGSQFDLRTGDALTPPACTPVQIFPVELASVDGVETVFVGGMLAGSCQISGGGSHLANRLPEASKHDWVNVPKVKENSMPELAGAQKQEVKSIICEILEVDSDELKGADKFIEDHGADSLLAIEILAKLETNLGVTIDQAELSRMTTLENVYVVLAEVTARA